MAFMLTDNRILDDNGRPLSGGKVYVYEAGTTTPIDSFPTAAAANAGTPVNSNPVILNAAGIARIYGKDDVVYKVVIKDRDDTTIETIDNISLNGGESAAAAASAALAASASASSAASSASSAAASAEAASESAIAAQSSANLATPTVVNFTGDGSTTDFELPYAVDKNSTNVFVSGQYQGKGAYTIVSGTTLRFLVAPANGVNIEVNLAATSAMVSGDTTQVNYNNGASGAVTRSVRDKLREIVSVKDFGVVGDGVADDTAALQRVIDENPGAEIRLIDVTCRITDEIVITSSGTRLVGDRAVIDGSEIPAGGSLNERRAIGVRGTMAGAVSITSDVDVGAFEVDVSDPSGFAEGDIVEITSEQPYIDGVTEIGTRRGEIVIVKGVSGSTVELYTSTMFSYSVAHNATAQKINAVRDVHISGLDIRLGGVGSAHTGIRFEKAFNVSVKNCRIKGGEDNGIGFAYTMQGVVSGCDISDFTSPGFSTTGYGVSIGYASRDILVEGNRFVNGRHGVSGANLNRSVGPCVVRNNTLHGCNLDCHEACFYFTFDGNTVSGSYATGILARGPGVTVVNNRILGAPENGIRVGSFYDNPLHGAVVSNNVIKNTGQRGIYIAGESDARIYDAVVSGNIVESATFSGIEFTETDDFVCSGNIINGVLDGGSTGRGIYVDNNCARGVLEGNRVMAVSHEPVRIDSSVDISLSGNSLSGAGQYVVRVTESSDVAINGGNLAAEDGAVGYAEAVRVTNSDRVIVNGVRATGPESQSSGGAFVRVDGTSNGVSVVSNIARKWYAFLRVDGSDADGIVVTGNNTGGLSISTGSAANVVNQNNL